MKKTIAAIALAAIVLSAIGLSFLARAATFEAAETSILDASYDDDLYVFGGTVVVNKDINGDLLIFGGNVEVAGNVAGDVLIAGGQVVLSGDVSDDVRVAGGWVNINASVGDDVIVVGGTVSMSTLSTVGGDVYGSSGNANLNGNYSGDVTFVASTLVFGGTILGNASFTSESGIHIADNARIEGNLSYRSSSQLAVDSSIVGGRVAYQKSAFSLSGAKEQIADETSKVTSAGFIFMKIWSYLSFLVIGFVLMLLVPYSFRSTTGVVTTEYWKSLLYGLAFIIGLPIVSIMLIFTLVGFKLALMLLLLLAVYWVLAKIYAGYIIGSLIFMPKNKTSKFWRDFGRMALGLFLLLMLSAIPYIGLLFNWVVVFISLGGFVIYNWNVVTELRKKKMV
ncbi:hypothetical protein COW94_00110 [Candidatus Peregrinibacteria bacterium CG22_combo_CG10-13_8_21_14_all_44_10]|nr:MAG: hypothetical protein AUK45_01335 [Candidatus Peregrinibacteria bacterium CG2_30_44_17]PIP66738.1 MAG: hypothetical protein COW94_00110 [Candidatus Peregrinibacteria bacterium CG22_combo_CG10-13_8_21_14_all_44_10]PIS04257.1 MAG: hypothetical protein COT83_01610 [Candidatus Peregrinibacteria bacterium CG10_big_fil_rev_8_21_14_0_10_44_7]PIX80404.1 MAG: hypothetical protein COZ35_00845 [Candidatus Peregrinibacteria bacterium CG_4_10_14_3_um_filter_44_21]PJB89659.1 MAG: hypothetical protein 